MKYHEMQQSKFRLPVTATDAISAKPLISPGWAAVRIYRHKNKDGGLVVLIGDTILFVDNTAALHQSSDSHLEQQGISIAMPNRQQLHIHYIYIPPRSSCNAGHNASISHLLNNNEMLLIVGDIDAHHSTWHANTNEDERGEHLADEIGAPSYVTDMLHIKPLHTRNTRSSSYTMPLLNGPAHSKATFVDRSFSFASSSVWNSIPNDVSCAPSLSSSKSRLKTYLFRSAYKD